FNGRPCFWANQADTWQGITHRDLTLQRWATDIQNDFRARLEWCVKPPNEANHPPRVIVNGVEGTEVLRLSPAVSTELTLDAAGSSDSDGDRLNYAWSIYAEAGTYFQPVRMDGAASPRARVWVPADAVGKEIHVVVAVTDSGKPPL